jgi:phage shock protein A
MSVLGLARRLVRTSVGALLAPAEDPRAGFADTYQRQRLLLGRVQAALAAVRESRGRLAGRAEGLRGELPLLDEHARAAVVSGRDDLARLRLRRREVVAALLRRLDAQQGELEREEASLALIEQRLATEIEAFYARQEVIAARYSAAEAQVRINESMTGVSVELRDLGLALEQAEEGAERMRARASAIEELAAAGELGGPAEVSGGSGGLAGGPGEVSGGRGGLAGGPGGPSDSDLDRAVETRLALVRASFERT